MHGEPKPVTFKDGVDTGEPAARNKACLTFVDDLVDGADVLDVGCWAGAFASLALGRASTVSAVDIDRSALEIGKSRFKEVRFAEASVFTLPFAESSFDIVTLWDVLEHLPVGSESDALEEISRVLRPGGYLAISVPNDRLLARLLDPMYFPKKHRHYSSKSLRHLLEKAGFTVRREAVKGSLITALDFLVFCFWKYLLGKPGPASERYRRICEKDACRDGFVEFFLLAENKGLRYAE